MTIELNELAGLLGDKARFARIDHLVGRVIELERMIAESEEEIARVDLELRGLGIDLGDGSARADHAERDDAEAGIDDPAAPAAARAIKPRRKPALPTEDPSDPRSVSEYVNALDEVAHELGAVRAGGAAGATGIRGVDVTEAMQRRGFPNGKRVLKVARAHPNWSEVAGARSRFRYAAAAQGEEDELAAVDETEVNSDRALVDASTLSSPPAFSE